MRGDWRGILIVTLFCGLSGRLAAQVVTGTVVLRDSTTAVQGVIVEASAGPGRPTVRALTNATGAFSMSLSGAGSYSLRVLRIGYRPTAGPAVTVGSADTTRVTIVFGSQAVTLPSVAIREKETCRLGADSGLVVARIWDEARKAMLSTQLTADAPLFAEWIEYDRILDSTSHFVRGQRIRTSRHPTTHAFRSRPAELLDSVGYVVGDATGAQFFAPDADVLLSETFAATHCFRTVPARADQPRLIGVAFVPGRSRGEHRDIEGTLWLDRQSAEMRYLEFKYTNLSDVAESANPGGRIEFLRTNTGTWLVSRWSVRMPQLAAVPRSSLDGTRRTISALNATYVQSIQVTGGEVSRVTRDDSLIYERKGPRIAVQVRSPDATVSAAGATVALDGTDYTGTADSSGRIVITPVLDGRYHVTLRTAMLDSLEVPAATGEVETHEDARVDTLVLPKASELLARICPRDSIAHGEGLLFGTVRSEHATGIAQAAVTVTWQANFDIVGASTSHQVRYTEKTIGGYTDAAGHWRLCGVERDRPLGVRVVSDSGSDAKTMRLTDAFAAVDLVVRRDGRSLATSARDAQAHALVELAVFDLQGAPLSGAMLEVRLADGSMRRVITGGSGRALLPDVKPGVITVSARRIGLKPGRVAATIEPGRNTVPIMLGESVAPMLDTMRVVGGRSVLARLDEFETRRINHLATVSITREDIRKRNPVDAWQMLTAVPSILIVDSAAVTAESTRSQRLRPDLSIEKCYIAVMIDGMIMNGNPSDKAFDLRQLPKPEEIHGIEVFAGPSSIPMQYGGTGDGKWCGMIAVWTR